MNRLKIIRIENNKTQEQMAKELEIGISTYNQYENSERDIPYSVAKNIAKLFEVEIDSIFLPTRFTVSKTKEEETKVKPIK